MQAEHVEQQQDIVVIGPALRTSYQKATSDIPAFWQRFSEERTLERLPRRPDDPSVYAVYCDYEGDHRDAYTMVLGVAADAHANVPAGMRKVSIPNGRYARFVAKGDPTQTLWQTWQHISEQWDKRNERRFAADFERYDLASLALPPGAAIAVDVVVGLR